MTPWSAPRSRCREGRILRLRRCSLDVLRGGLQNHRSFWMMPRRGYCRGSVLTSAPSVAVYLFQSWLEFRPVWTRSWKDLVGGGIGPMARQSRHASHEWGGYGGAVNGDRLPVVTSYVVYGPPRQHRRPRRNRRRVPSLLMADTPNDTRYLPSCVVSSWCASFPARGDDDALGDRVSNRPLKRRTRKRTKTRCA